MAGTAKIFSFSAAVLSLGALSLWISSKYWTQKTSNGKLCGVDFDFARTYGPQMVLQRAPARARIWGYGFDVGDSVTVGISGGKLYKTTTIKGKASRPIWEVDIDPMEEGGPYIINATSKDCTIYIDNILFGDVWMCSGQSNMAFELKDINDPQAELDDVVNYPDVRTFFTQLQYSKTPQEDVGSGSRNWIVPTKDALSSFSAVCWLFGKQLYQKYKRPIGLIQSAWGGTRVEAWSSPLALEECYGDDVPVAFNQNEASGLFNSMIHPFFPMPIYGAIWYQGEANVNEHTYYGCALNAMVKDWRKTWYSATPTMQETFPFGEVQLAPVGKGDSSMGTVDIRWQQTYQFGYVPNYVMDKFFMAVAMDLPDFHSPLGPIHPRYKRPVAARLALGAYNVAYDDTSNGTYQGPFPNNMMRDGSNLVIFYVGQTLVQRGDPNTYFGFEICCSSHSQDVCQQDGSNWHNATIASVQASQIALVIPCAEGDFMTGVRYAWKTSPCDVIQECAIYADQSGNNLPAPPFIRLGPIA